MKVSLKWLQQYAHFDTDMHTFMEAMTMAGQKVETIETEKDNCKNVVIGKVLEIEQHPNADKLVVCQINIGDKTVQIVTGASNLHVGDVIPVALDGSVLPCGKEIHKGELRGVESNGMLCSLSELGFTTHDFPECIEDGIMVLDSSLEIGADATVALGMDDYGIDFEITPNRPDCLSVVGLAKEAAAVFKTPYISPDVEYPQGEGDINELLKISIDTDKCSRYIGGMIKNVRVKPSPQWLRERLRVCGVRPINNIVDITNYTMLLYGHPMHAFDYKYVNGNSINVRSAKAGEEIMTLDGVQRKLTERMMVIADEKEPIAVAGVMGGEYSGVYDDTNMVVFESACFDGPDVRLTSRGLNLRTEASGKYEKGLNPDNCMPAICFALNLVKELDAGDIIGGYIDVYNTPRVERKVELDVAKINKILGTQLASEEIVSLLESVELKVNDGIVTIPTHRYDIAKDEVTAMNDLAEEVARLYGYDRLPSTIMKGEATARPSDIQRFEKQAINTLLGFGYYEIETYSFYSPKNFDLLNLPTNDELRNAVVISNPLGEDTSIMRTTAVASMMTVLQRNFNSRVEQVSLFEYATEYAPTTIDQLPVETNKIIMGIYGKDKDFFTIKGAVERLIKSFNISGVDFIPNKTGTMYHPGRCADVYIKDVKVGTIGQMHPQVLINYDMKANVYVADLDLQKIFDSVEGTIQYQQLARFPAMSRDIALVCDTEKTNGEIIKVISKCCPDYLESVSLFDVYTGSHMQEGKKSMAYNLMLRDKKTTLTDEIADNCVKEILEELSKIDVILRT